MMVFSGTSSLLAFVYEFCSLLFICRSWSVERFKMKVVLWSESGEVEVDVQNGCSMRLQK